MAADMLNTGLYGAQLADVQPGDTVVVMGVGPVGLMAIAGAKLRGAGRILAIGSRPAGLALAQFYGATDLVNYKEDVYKRQAGPCAEDHRRRDAFHDHLQGRIRGLLLC